MKNIAELMKNAKKMQDMMKQQQEELTRTEVSGEAGAGAVKIRMNGKYQVLEVTIDPEFMKESAEVVGDLIAAAFNNASGKIESLVQEKMMSAGKMLGGMGSLGDFLK